MSHSRLNAELFGKPVSLVPSSESDQPWKLVKPEHDTVVDASAITMLDGYVFVVVTVENGQSLKTRVLMDARVGLGVCAKDDGRNRRHREHHSQTNCTDPLHGNLLSLWPTTRVLRNHRETFSVRASGTRMQTRIRASCVLIEPTASIAPGDTAATGPTNPMNLRSVSGARRFATMRAAGCV